MVGYGRKQDSPTVGQLFWSSPGGSLECSVSEESWQFQQVSSVVSDRSWNNQVSLKELATESVGPVRDVWIFDTVYQDLSRAYIPALCVCRDEEAAL